MGHLKNILSGNFKEYKFYKSVHFYFSSKEEKKSFITVAYDVIRLSLHWKCFAYHYFQYEFFLKSNHIKYEEMLSYLPNQKWENQILTQSKRYVILCEDKALFQDIATYYDLPMPELVFRFEKGTFYDFRNNLVEKTDVRHLIERQNSPKIFVKGYYGLHGVGISVFKKTAKGYENEEGHQLCAEYFTKNCAGQLLVVQAGIVQHESLNKVYSKAVNTLRVVTRNNSDGTSEILGAVIKFARGGVQVDNLYFGSISVAIEKETGHLKGSGITYYNTLKFKTHPDTQVVFDGIKIEFWDEVKSIVLNASQKFNKIHILGFDIAISDQGPVIVEMNEAPGIHVMQMLLGGKRDWLKI